MKLITITTKQFVTAAASALALLLVVSCSAAEQKQDQQWVSLAKKTDSEIYQEKCGMCHLPNGMGTGILSRRYQGDLALLEKRTDLQAAFIEVAVRNGFNTMFPISRAEVSDGQLQAIVRHLTKNKN